MRRIPLNPEEAYRDFHHSRVTREQINEYSGPGREELQKIFLLTFGKN